MSYTAVLATLVATAALGVLAVLTPVEGGLSHLPYEGIFEPAGTSSTSSTTTSTTTSASVAETTTESKTAEEDCQEQIGTIQNGVPVNTMRKYDVEKILEEHGGPAGKLNVTWNKDVPEFPVADPKAQPLEDTDNGTFWVYDYRHTDYKTYVRLEHALLRHKGQTDEYVDIRGVLYWTPPDFCDRARHATYRANPHEGFKADVSLEYCNIGSESLQCAFPANCFSNETFYSCVAAPSSALLASLVG